MPRHPRPVEVRGWVGTWAHVDDSLSFLEATVGPPFMNEDTPDTSRGDSRPLTSFVGRGPVVPRDSLFGRWAPVRTTPVRVRLPLLQPYDPELLPQLEGVAALALREEEEEVEVGEISVLK